MSVSFPLWASWQAQGKCLTGLIRDQLSTPWSLHTSSVAWRLLCPYSSLQFTMHLPSRPNPVRWASSPYHPITPRLGKRKNTELLARTQICPHSSHKYWQRMCVPGTVLSMEDSTESKNRHRGKDEGRLNGRWSCGWVDRWAGRLMGGQVDE